MLIEWFTLQGTNIAAGKARGVVVGTGLNTEIGESLWMKLEFKYVWWILSKLNVLTSYILYLYSEEKWFVCPILMYVCFFPSYSSIIIIYATLPLSISVQLTPPKDGCFGISISPKRIINEVLFIFYADVGVMGWTLLSSAHRFPSLQTKKSEKNPEFLRWRKSFCPLQRLLQLRWLFLSQKQTHSHHPLSEHPHVYLPLEGGKLDRAARGKKKSCS